MCNSDWHTPMMAMLLDAGQFGLISTKTTLTWSIPEEFIGYHASTDPTLMSIDISLHCCDFVTSVTPLLDNQTVSCLQWCVNRSLVDSTTGFLPCTGARPLAWYCMTVTCIIWISGQGSLCTTRCPFLSLLAFLICVLWLNDVESCSLFARVTRCPT